MALYNYEKFHRGPYLVQKAWLEIIHFSYRRQIQSECWKNFLRVKSWWYSPLSRKIVGFPSQDEFKKILDIYGPGCFHLVFWIQSRIMIFNTMTLCVNPIGRQMKDGKMFTHKSFGSANFFHVLNEHQDGQADSGNFIWAQNYIRSLHEQPRTAFLQGMSQDQN